LRLPSNRATQGRISAQHKSDSRRHPWCLGGAVPLICSAVAVLRDGLVRAADRIFAARSAAAGFGCERSLFRLLRAESHRRASFGQLCVPPPWSPTSSRTGTGPKRQPLTESISSSKKSATASARLCRSAQVEPSPRRSCSASSRIARCSGKLRSACHAVVGSGSGFVRAADRAAGV
jgi:hypothetical protein